MGNSDGEHLSHEPEAAITNGTVLGEADHYDERVVSSEKSSGRAP